MDPLTIGQQLKAKYPQYAQYPDEVLGRRWIEVNQKKTGGAAANPYAYLGGQQAAQTAPQDLSGLSKFNKPIQEQTEPRPDLSHVATAGQLGVVPGATALPAGGNASWAGSQVADFFRAPNLNAKSSSNLGF